MKRLHRPPAPACLCDGDAASPAQRHAWYQDLDYKSGELKDRWNSFEKDETGTSSIRRQLKQMSRECAWCEQYLEDGWQVDHWLPKKQFPLLAYCWENLLPSCPGCNRRKDAVAPPALREQPVVDPLLQAAHPGARPFIKSDLLPQLAERLVDPSHDDPAAHLEFSPAALKFIGITDAGKFTARHLFSEKDDAKRWARLNELVIGLVQKDVDDAVVELIIGCTGQGTVIRALCAYWRELLPRGPVGQGATAS